MNWGKSGILREASSDQVSETNATVYALLRHSWQPAGEDHDLVCNMIYLPQPKAAPDETPAVNTAWCCAMGLL